MNILYGTFRVSFDASGRISIPLKMRQAFPEALRDKIWVTIGYQACVAGYNEQEFIRFLNAVSAIQDSNELEKSELISSFSSNLADLTFDKQGRVVLPQHLISHANLQDCSEVLVIGVMNRLEIWNPELHQAQMQQSSQTVQNKLRSVNLNLATQINP
jgi:MraZ protein